jgi:TPR repeat protein
VTEALNYYRLAAHQGHVDAEVQVALCSYRGDGCRPDLFEALRYLKRAAAKNQANALVILGIGHCVDIVKAEEAFMMAACQHNAVGQFNYPIYRLQHIESEAAKVEVSRYFKSSADHGPEIGSVNYGVYLFGGIGVSVDLCEAAKYFGKASCQGDAYESFNYGVCLLECRGVWKNEKAAFECFEVLAKSMMLVVL